MTNADLAAWVQAIGSVIGIAIAIAVPWYQTRTARRDQQDERSKRAGALAVVLYPELVRMRGFINERRGYIRQNVDAFESGASDENSVQWFFQTVGLADYSLFQSHIHDSVWFEDELAKAYHGLEYEMYNYRMHTAALAAGRWNKENFHEGIARVYGLLDKFEVAEDHMRLMLVRKYLDNRPATHEMLTRKETA